MNGKAQKCCLTRISTVHFVLVKVYRLLNTGQKKELLEAPFRPVVRTLLDAIPKVLRG
jgi:hypothetical protein